MMMFLLAGVMLEISCQCFFFPQNRRLLSRQQIYIKNITPEFLERYLDNAGGFNTKCLKYHSFQAGAALYEDRLCYVEIEG